MQIRKQVLKQIAANTQLKVRLSEDLKKHYLTVERWVNENHFMLTTASALKVIREELQLTDSQILEETKKQNA